MYPLILPLMDGTSWVSSYYDINDQQCQHFLTTFKSTCLEIQKMMYGFGDSKYSLKETAELVEKIVKEQLIQFLNALSEVAVKINSKKIGIKEFLVLLR